MRNKAIFALAGLLALGTSTRAHVVPVEPKLAISRQAPDGRAMVIVESMSAGDYLQINSDFYLQRKTDFGSALSATVQVIGAKFGPAKPITLFVTFLPGERERLVEISPIVRDFFSDQPTFVRISS